MLGLMAWCMQLVIFVQPFLPGQSMPGLGVCQVIVDAFAQSNSHQMQSAHLAQGQAAKLTQQHTQHDLMPHQASDNHQLTQPRYITQSTLPFSQYPQVDHHFSHLSCGFCILYGHAIPPPETPTLWSQLIIDAYIALPQFLNDNNNILAADYLQPKSRAPPIIYFS